MDDDFPDGSSRGSFLDVLLAFLRLGLNSFVGPVAHLGYFRDGIVVRRKWLDEMAYVDLVALCQFLPEPASSQVGIALGIRRGIRGALTAWRGFTTPSPAGLALFAYGVAGLGTSMVRAGSEAIGNCREKGHRGYIFLVEAGSEFSISRPFPDISGHSCDSGSDRPMVQVAHCSAGSAHKWVSVV